MIMMRISSFDSCQFDSGMCIGRRCAGAGAGATTIITTSTITDFSNRFTIVMVYK